MTDTPSTDDILELVSEMKRLGVAFFEIGHIKVCFREPGMDLTPVDTFSDQRKVIEELMKPDLDSEGKPASEPYSDEDLYG